MAINVSPGHRRRRLGGGSVRPTSGLKRHRDGRAVKKPDFSQTAFFLFSFPQAEALLFAALTLHRISPKNKTKKSKPERHYSPRSSEISQHPTVLDPAENSPPTYSKLGGNRYRDFCCKNILLNINRLLNKDVNRENCKTAGEDHYARLVLRRVHFTPHSFRNPESDEQNPQFQKSLLHSRAGLRKRHRQTEWTDTVLRNTECTERYRCS